MEEHLALIHANEVVQIAHNQKPKRAIKPAQAHSTDAAVQQRKDASSNLLFTTRVQPAAVRIKTKKSGGVRVRVEK